MKMQKINQKEKLYYCSNIDAYSAYRSDIYSVLLGKEFY